jgi:hypothetical protein
MVTTKSKLQMEFNKEVTSASSGLVYVCFGSFVKCSRVLTIAGKKSNLSITKVLYKITTREIT